MAIRDDIETTKAFSNLELALRAIQSGDQGPEAKTALLIAGRHADAAERMADKLEALARVYAHAAGYELEEEDE